tara:strand:- start:1190 stop:1420 length:231 start_codon:yes stop_codon:yes gene_type:complete
VAVVDDVALTVAIALRSLMYTIAVTDAPADNESDSRTLVALDVIVAVLAMADAASTTINAADVALDDALAAADAST